jgi:Icc-related predicted phosphoesterase
VCVRILCVSDVVSPQLYPSLDRSLIGRVELVVSCGDLPPEYPSFLTNSLNVPLFYVSGNHDIRYSQKPPEGLNLHGRMVRFRGVNVLGLAGSHWYNGGPHQYTEKQMRATIRRLRLSIWRHGGVDLIIAHSPPRHVGDGDDLCHRGFESFQDLIRRYEPQYFVHGHIHTRFDSPQDRITVVNGTQVVNAYGFTILEIADQG